MHDFIFGKCLIPLYLKLKGLSRIKHLKKLQKRNYLTQEELLDIQWQKLKNIAHHCYNKIPYYKKLFDAHKIKPEEIKTLKDYSKIPKLSKQNIRQHYKELINPDIPKSKLRYDSTSGSTGIPLKLARSQEDQEYGFALRYRSNEWCGWKFFEKSVWIVSDQMKITELNKIIGKIRLWLLRRLVFDTKNTSEKDMQEWVMQIKKFKPGHVYGYSSLLARFAEFIVKNNIKIEGIKGVYSTSESLKERVLISKAFKAPVYDQYGASEVPCIAHECPRGNIHLAIDEVLVEFEDIEGNDDIKQMIITPLYTYGMPLLRYEIQDCATISNKQCDCGLPYPVIELKIGRISDNLIAPAGQVISGVTLSWYITESTEGIEQYQIVQEEINKFSIRLVCKEDKKFQNEVAIKNLIAELLNTQDLKFNFEYPEKILPGSNGKLRPIISHAINKQRESIDTI